MNRNFLIVFALFAASILNAQKVHHVSPSGNDANDGTSSKPLKTIQAAANRALPGDVVTVHEGIYRESVNPPRGGASDKKRIIFQSAPNEKVVITGSEEIKNWEKVIGNTWKITLPNSYFGNFNPYSDQIRGDWFTDNGRIHHTGCVYINGDWAMEATKMDEVIQPEGKEPLWYAIVDGDKNVELVNIASFKPNNAETVAADKPSLRYGTKPKGLKDGTKYSGAIFNGNFMRFDNVDFGSGSESIDFKVASARNCVIEIRLGSSQGELLGTCKLNSTGDWKKWANVAAKIKATKGKQSVFLVFLGDKYLEGKTTIYAYFPNINPNEATVEINKRQTVFYPSKNFINYITVKGFTLENAATNWAPPSSEQTAIVGTNWSKGWIIENNTIRYSKCCGVSLGKYGDGTDNTNDNGDADPYTACVKRALKYGWNKDSIGSHIVRNNHIHHCEQTGIVGSMGCAFSKVIGNEIHDIHLLGLFSGQEMAGIKFHGAIDVEIKDNHIYKCGDIGGLWLDWMAQGALITGNLFHDNLGYYGDVFLEMQHGPMVFANNLFLSKPTTIGINSKGIAFAHNLIASNISNYPGDSRLTPFHKAHSTEIAGLYNNNPSGDHRFYNNVFTASCKLKTIDKNQLECFASGNVFVNGAQNSKFDKDSLVDASFDPEIKLAERNGEWFLEFNASTEWTKNKYQKLITTEVLGKAKIPNIAYENADGTPLKITTDYFGKKRNNKTPFPGAIEIVKSGKQEFKVWPKQ